MARCVKCGKWAGIFRDGHDYDCVGDSTAAIGISTISAGEVAHLTSEYSRRVVKRYREAYGNARATNALGGTIKTLGAVVGILAVLLGLKSLGDTRELGSSFMGLLMIMVGIIIGITGWAMGAVIQAGAQMTLAQLDCAVNTSPFLTNEQRASMMSL